jgi:two-component system chemotaxis response regulator CheB
MASTLTLKNADISLKALELGATDYLPKPTSTIDAGIEDFKRELTHKVMNLGVVARRRGLRLAPDTKVEISKITSLQPATTKIIPARILTFRPMPTAKPDIIAIGSSTGGPQALFDVIKSMGSDLSQPIVITQHMPPSFTAILAEHIQRQCKVNCVEAKDGHNLAGGHYYIAPGNYHMLVQKNRGCATIKLSQDPPENFCRPAVDPMLRSLVAVYGPKVLVAILTGMGQDGGEGAKMVVAAGGAVLAQDEASSVVWGMPGTVAMAGVTSGIFPVNEIGAVIKKIASKAL